MRAIDGDALYKVVQGHHDLYNGATNHADKARRDELLQVMCDINDAPTVTPDRPKAVWQYHNDEHGVWWGCGNCGKILCRPPNDKRFCSRCGAEMEREA